MYTSMTVIALTSLLTLPGTDGPSWQTDYSAARKQAASAGKPLAVFFGGGQTGYEKVAREGLNGATRKVLAKDYVCCYVDVTTPAGKQLAKDFEITRGVGVVVSDRSGKSQAFHYDGDLSVGDLRRCLERFGDPNLVVNTTVTDPHAQTSSYSPQSAPSYSNYPPNMGFGQPYPGFQPSFGGGGFGGGFGGGRGGC
jgi:hypothetical protein